MLVECKYLVEKLALLLLEQREDVLGCCLVGVAACGALDCCSVLVSWRGLAPAEHIVIIAAPGALYHLSSGLWVLAAKSAHWNKIVKVIGSRRLHIGA